MWKWLTDKDVVPFLILIVAVALLTSSMRWRRRKKTPAAPVAPRPSTRKADVEPIRRDLDILLVELQELSRRISAEIDTRFVKLEAAIRDADRRIAVMNRLSRQTGERPEQTASKNDFEARHSVVYELADSGFSPVEIARDLGKTPGEIELILNLRKQKAKT